MNETTVKEIKVQKDYYGNRDYGKRAMWLLNEHGKKTNNFVFVDYFDVWKKEKESEGFKITIIQ